MDELTIASAHAGIGGSEAVIAIAHQKSGRAMTIEEITEEAIRRGLLHPRSSTPPATMGAALYVHLRKAPGSDIVQLYEPESTGRSRTRWAFEDTIRQPDVIDAFVGPAGRPVPATRADGRAVLVLAARSPTGPRSLVEPREYVILPQ
jgi:HB1, ASXL, restriction endonuclease HTH domain